ncbi:MAG: hypothetical protein HAW58_06900 [Candidatus Thioglobus sp.]|nr:hypothetical protein [Candidatus Thioglobus sp.]
MSIEKIKAYPEITEITIENDKVKSLVQEYNDLEKVQKHIKNCIETVRNYTKKGYYNLVQPEFVDEVITVFSNLELSKKDVIRVNNFIEIAGFPQCNRIWQLPDEMKVQASKMLGGFEITYDSENWEDFSLQPLEK